MADEVDVANDRAQAERDALAQVRKPEPVIFCTGRCLNCNARVGKDRRWCDGDCRDAWEEDQIGRV